MAKELAGRNIFEAADTFVRNKKQYDALLTLKNKITPHNLLNNKVDFLVSTLIGKLAGLSPVPVIGSMFSFAANTLYESKFRSKGAKETREYYYKSLDPKNIEKYTLKLEGSLKALNNTLNNFKKEITNSKTIDCSKLYEVAVAFAQYERREEKLKYIIHININFLHSLDNSISNTSTGNRTEYRILDYNSETSNKEVLLKKKLFADIVEKEASLLLKKIDHTECTGIWCIQHQNTPSHNKIANSNLLKYDKKPLLNNYKAYNLDDDDDDDEFTLCD